MKKYKIGDIRNGTEVLPIEDRKTILLLSDDLRMSSGVGTVSKNFVLGMLHRYKFCQAGGAIKHPEEGKVVDMNDSVREETGIEDAYLKIYPISGYGNQELLRQLMNIEKPDAILHYTDPRFWGWLYQMEHELRQHIPIFYYSIWDDRPTPRYNEFFYESSDLIMSISKQSVAMVRDAAVKKPRTDWDCTYVPHGIPEDKFFPINELDMEAWNKLQGYRKSVLHNTEKDFIVFWNNRNIRRKVPSDVIMAYKTFCDQLPKENADKCVLIMHTQPVDQNGTDLPRVVDSVCPDYDVIFSHQKIDDEQLNFLYNIADVTINIASNEGYGLGTAESLMSGTPITVNVTGGLQDQCGFIYKDKLLTEKDYDWVHSLHDDRKWKDNPDLTWGDWVKPVWPSNRSLQGSIPTPYIFDDRCRFDDVADRLMEWYNEGPEKRKEFGGYGREYLLTEEVGMSAKLMCDRFVHDMDTAFEKWTPRKRFTLYKV